MMVDYWDAVKRPFMNFRKFSIGSILYMIPFANFVTNFFANGYILRAARLTAVEGEFILPEWTKWGDLFVKGLLMVIISALYFVPFTLIAFLIEGSPFFLAIAGAGEFPPFDIGLIIVLIILLITLYIIPLVIVHYAVRERFGSMFDFRIIFRKTFHGEYLLVWIISIIYSGIAGAIAGALSSVLEFTIIGPYIIGGILSFVAGVTVFTLIAEVYREVR